MSRGAQRVYGRRARANRASIRLVVRLVSGGGLLAAAVLGPGAVRADERSAPFAPAQVAYLERCGGCHGIQGGSAPREVPTIRGRMRYFLCTAEARAYLIRLPAIANASLSDAALADLMNFVVFDLGGAQDLAPSTETFTAREVGALRARPLDSIALMTYRAKLVEDLIGRCGAPDSLREYGTREPADARHDPTAAPSPR